MKSCLDRTDRLWPRYSERSGRAVQILALLRPVDKYVRQGPKYRLYNRKSYLAGVSVFTKILLIILASPFVIYVSKTVFRKLLYLRGRPIVVP
jgi:hypothetical protein